MAAESQAQKDARVASRRLSRRWRRLNSDSHFVRETAALLNQLEHAKSKRPVAIQHFFQAFRQPNRFGIPFIRDVIGALDDKSLRKLLWRCVRYAFRFMES
jgi:hypothetical protein